MSASSTNQAHTRANTFSGSPKKNAAWRSLSNMKGGNKPGAVSKCQSAKSDSSKASCHRRRYFRWAVFMASGRLQLLRIAFQHFVAQHGPNGTVQFNKAGRCFDLGHVTRAWQVDVKFTDRV